MSQKIKDPRILFDQIEKKLKKLTHRNQVMFVLYCAKLVQKIGSSIEDDKAIEVTEKWLRGEATRKECNQAADDSYELAVINKGVWTASMAAYSTFCPTGAVEAGSYSAAAVYAVYANSRYSSRFSRTSSGVEEKDLGSDMIKYLDFLTKEDKKGLPV